MSYNTFEYIEQIYVELALLDPDKAPMRDGVLLIVQRMNASRVAVKAMQGSFESLVEALAMFAALTGVEVMDDIVKAARPKVRAMKGLIHCADKLPLDVALRAIREIPAEMLKRPKT